MVINSAPVLQLTNLSVSLSNKHILDKISLTVQRNTIHAIIGPNGAGKTTLLRCLLGAMPHQGEVCFGFNAGGIIGYVPQFVEFDHTLPLTVGDFFHMLMSRRPVFFGRSRKNRTTILELLALTQCEHLIDQPMSRLSGGELRRAFIAQALIRKPELLLLDEPANNMDELSGKSFEALLMHLKNRQNVTIILIDHDFNRVLRLADQFSYINKLLLFTGTPAEFEELPATIISNLTDSVQNNQLQSAANQVRQAKPLQTNSLRAV